MVITTGRTDGRNNTFTEDRIRKGDLHDSIVYHGNRTEERGRSRDLSGEFDAEAACMVAEMIHRYASQGTRVFVNVDEHTRITPGGGEKFLRHSERLAFAPDMVFFKGERTLDLAPQGYRVLVPKPVACSCKAARCGNGGCGKGSSCCKNKDEHHAEAKRNVG